MQRFTRIKGLSEARRLPRLGKIRLGIKVPNKDKDPAKCSCKGVGCSKCTHPKETEYFICPPEVTRFYGTEPTELDVMFPIEDEEMCFPQAYKLYGSQRGIKCTGDGERALRANEKTGEMEDVECPSPDNCNFCKNDKGKPQCSRCGNLMMLLPKVSMGGVYQIDTGSIHSTIDVNSGIDVCRAMLGRISLVPLKLKRVPRVTHGSGIKEIHYTLQLEVAVNIEQLQAYRRDQNLIMAPGIQYLLPEPDIINGSPIVNLREEDEAGNGVVHDKPPETISNKIEGDLTTSIDPLDVHYRDWCQAGTEERLGRIQELQGLIGFVPGDQLRQEALGKMPKERQLSCIFMLQQLTNYKFPAAKAPEKQTVDQRGKSILYLESRASDLLHNPTSMKPEQQAHYVVFLEEMAIGLGKIKAPEPELVI